MMGTTREHLSERCAEEILRRFEKIWGMDRVQRHQDLGRRRFENDTFYSQITITMKSDNRRLLVTCIRKVATLTDTTLPQTQTKSDSRGWKRSAREHPSETPNLKNQANGWPTAGPRCDSKRDPERGPFFFVSMPPKGPKSFLEYLFP